MTIPILWMRKLRPGEGKQPTQDYPARYWQKCFTDSDVLTCRPLSLPAGLSLESGPFPHEGPAEELAGPGAPLVLPGAERGQLPPAWARQPRPQGRGASAMREPGEQTARPSEQGSSRGAHFQGLLDLPRLTSSPCIRLRGAGRAGKTLIRSQVSAQVGDVSSQSGLTLSKEARSYPNRGWLTSLSKGDAEEVLGPGTVSRL